MPTPQKTLIDLEKKFWQSMVNQDTDTALAMLSEPSLMVSSQGAMKFDHAAYRQMAEHGNMVITSFELSDVEVVFPNDATAIVTYRVKQGVAPRGESRATQQVMNDSSTWVKNGGGWQCVMHTETPAEGAPTKH
jgi:hypothetical protein